MAIPIPGISWCVLFTFFFSKEQNALAFNWETWCHLTLCLQMMIPPYQITSQNANPIVGKLFLCHDYCLIQGRSGLSG
jgi:hypothetical protein